MWHYQTKFFEQAILQQVQEIKNTEKHNLRGTENKEKPTQKHNHWLLDNQRVWEDLHSQA